MALIQRSVFILFLLTCILVKECVFAQQLDAQEAQDRPSQEYRDKEQFKENSDYQTTEKPYTTPQPVDLSKSYFHFNIGGSGFRLGNAPKNVGRDGSLLKYDNDGNLLPTNGTDYLSLIPAGIVVRSRGSAPSKSPPSEASSQEGNNEARPNSDDRYSKENRGARYEAPPSRYDALPKSSSQGRYESPAARQTSTPSRNDPLVPRPGRYEPPVARPTPPAARIDNRQNRNPNSYDVPPNRSQSRYDSQQNRYNAPQNPQRSQPARYDSPPSSRTASRDDTPPTRYDAPATRYDPRPSRYDAPPRQQYESQRYNADNRQQSQNYNRGRDYQQSARPRSSPGSQSSNAPLNIYEEALKKYAAQGTAQQQNYKSSGSANYALQAPAGVTIRNYGPRPQSSYDDRTPATSYKVRAVPTPSPNSQQYSAGYQTRPPPLDVQPQDSGRQYYPNKYQSRPYEAPRSPTANQQYSRQNRHEDYDKPTEQYDNRRDDSRQDDRQERPTLPPFRPTVREFKAPPPLPLDKYFRTYTAHKEQPRPRPVDEGRQEQRPYEPSSQSYDRPSQRYEPPRRDYDEPRQRSNDGYRPQQITQRSYNSQSYDNNYQKRLETAPRPSEPTERPYQVPRATPPPYQTPYPPYQPSVTKPILPPYQPLPYGSTPYQPVPTTVRPYGFPIASSPYAPPIPYGADPLPIDPYGGHPADAVAPPLHPSEYDYGAGAGNYGGGAGGYGGYQPDPYAPPEVVHNGLNRLRPRDGGYAKSS